MSQHGAGKGLYCYRHWCRQPSRVCMVEPAKNHLAWKKGQPCSVAVCPRYIRGLNPDMDEATTASNGCGATGPSQPAALLQ